MHVSPSSSSGCQNLQTEHADYTHRHHHSKEEEITLSASYSQEVNGFKIYFLSQTSQGSRSVWRMNWNSRLKGDGENDGEKKDENDGEKKDGNDGEMKDENNGKMKD